MVAIASLHPAHSIDTVGTIRACPPRWRINLKIRISGRRIDTDSVDGIAYPIARDDQAATFVKGDPQNVR